MSYIEISVYSAKNQVPHDFSRKETPRYLLRCKTYVNNRDINNKG